jgi:hypothetical protein
MLILQILAGCAVFVLGLIFLQINQISGAIMTVSHQLEELGAPLEVRDGKLVAVRTAKPDKQSHF